MTYDLPMAARTVPNDRTRVLVLHGIEHALQQEVMGALQQAMEAKHGAVERLHFDGEQCQLAQVMDELRTFGLMAPYKLVVVDNSEPFVRTYRQVLERYAQDPVDHATLVLRSDRWYKGKLDQLVSKVGGVIRCERLSRSQLQRRLQDRAQAEYGRTLGEGVAQLLIDRIGKDLGRLHTELEKLALRCESGAIDAALVKEVVGECSEEQAWAVQEALLRELAGSSKRTAIQKLRELIDVARQPDVLVAYFIADLVRKLYYGVIMKQQGVPLGQIAAKMKMWGPRQAAFGAAVERLDASRIAELFDQVVQYDLRAKTGLGKASRNTECFCANVQ